MHNHAFEILTQHLKLRIFNKTDFPALFKILTEPGIAKYYPRITPPDEASIRQSIEHNLHNWQEFGYTKWAVILRTTNQLIGRCGLDLLTDTNEIELGYVLGHNYWGKGYATEAARASLDYGFNQLKLKEIIGLTHPENHTSQRVLLKAGMKFRGDFEYSGLPCKKYSKRIPS